jgi:hypothetical protein
MVANFENPVLLSDRWRIKMDSRDVNLVRMRTRTFDAIL